MSGPSHKLVGGPSHKLVGGPSHKWVVHIFTVTDTFVNKQHFRDNITLYNFGCNDLVLFVMNSFLCCCLVSSLTLILFDAGGSPASATKRHVTISFDQT